MSIPEQYRSIPILQEGKSYSLPVKEISYTPGMDAVRQLIVTRADDLGTNLAELSRAVGRNHAYLQQFVQRGVPANLPEDVREKLAPLLKVTQRELRGEGPRRVETGRAELRLPQPKMMGRRDLPVFTSAEGGSGTLILSTDPIEYVPRPYTLDGIPDAYAIVVEGTSMVYAFEPGDIAWVNPRFPPARDTDAILYSITEERGESRATIKRLIGFDDRAWTLQQHNPKKTFKLPRAEWQRCHRVVGKFSRRR